MSVLIEWLAIKAAGFEILYFVGGTVILYISYAIFLHAFAKNFIRKTLAIFLKNESVHSRRIVFAVISVNVFLMPLVEELFFRVLLIGLAVWLFGISPWVVIVAASASILFGYMHGSVRHIACQGINGFLYSMLFLKCGGFQGEIVVPFFATTAAHILNNGVVYIFTFLVSYKKTRNRAK